MPPLQTRPKAALVGVGRHVILRPAVPEALPRVSPSRRSRIRPRTSNACSPRWTTSSCASHSTSCATLGGTLRSSDFSVTAVLCDDLLLAVEPGDTTGRTFALAFDLGTTTVVANLLDLEHGPAAGGALAAEQPAAVRSRRDLPRLGDDDRHRRARRPPGARARDARRARQRGLRRGRSAAGRGLRGLGRRQPDDGPDRARDRPRAALDGAVHDRGASALPPATAADFGVARPRARAGRAVPGARRLRRWRHRRRPARDRAHARSAHPALHRRRHEQRDRARLVGAGARDGGPRRPSLRGGADPLRHARRRRRDRGRQDP